MTRRVAAEFLGTAGLLLAVVGSGITASGDGAASAQLFQHAVVVGAVLAALIVALGPVSGAHFNPAVTLVDAVFAGISRRAAAAYVAAQLAGAVAGVVAANLLFGLPAVQPATLERAGAALLASEAVATFGLLVVIFGVVRSGRIAAVPAAVGAWVAGAIYATPSASFANPAVTVARAMTDTYTGIAPGDVTAFVVAQLLGAGAAAGAIALLFAPPPGAAADVVMPRSDDDKQAVESP